MPVGLGGSTRLVDIGGVPYLVPLADRTKLYDLAEMAELAELPGAFVIGAGAGSSRVAGVNCEVSANWNCISMDTEYALSFSDDAECSCEEFREFRGQQDPHCQSFKTGSEKNLTPYLTGSKYLVYCPHYMFMVGWFHCSGEIQFGGDWSVGQCPDV